MYCENLSNGVLVLLRKCWTVKYYKDREVVSECIPRNIYLYNVMYVYISGNQYKINVIILEFCFLNYIQSVK